ncbi:hypothetical protein J3R30DRAFT_3484582 [Lentinula aciculospora]|uniref:BZIP domain-containing protein n=1 Tax=Lentinula aciculospora TaxID=153920 RepID=A0A9W9AA71_9AGAR|nr:hypothetical protein J3R30DRAFT_3484582 [Lentinula aciculospora]
MSPMESYTNVYRWDRSPSVLLSSSPSSSSTDGYESGSSICDNGSELIPHGYRIFRSPIVRPTINSQPERKLVAISASYSHISHTHTSQDVLPSTLNNSTAFKPSTASHNGHSLPDALSKLPSPANSLAAHYGLPQALPRPPRTTLYTTMSQEKPLPDFESLSRNYLSMLASKPTDNTTNNNIMSLAHVPAEMPQPASSLVEDQDAALKAVVDTLIGTFFSVSLCSSLADSFDDYLSASPQFQMTSSLNEYLSSPFSTPYDDFNASPMDDSPFVPDLSTPIMDVIDEEFGWSGMTTGMDEPLFNDDASALYNMLVAAEPVKEVGPTAATPEMLNDKHLYTISPSTPALETMKGLYPSPRLPSVNAGKFATPSSSSGRKLSSATGTRRNITPDALLPLDAPTQTRRYITPSTTSRKDAPVSFAKKRSRSEAFEGDDDEHDDELRSTKTPGPDATEREKLEYKRRMSTIAARKSRRRKLEHKLMLEAKVDGLEKDVEKWKTRCKVLQEVLRSHAVDFRFEEEE